MNDLRGGILLGGLALLVGGGLLLYFVAIEPLSWIAASRNWKAVPCVIELSEFALAREGEGKPRPYAKIRYSFEWNGQSREGMRCDFWSDGALLPYPNPSLVEQYPRGLRTTCFVDPSEPSETVLSRALSWRMVWGLIPAMLIAVGAIMLLFEFALRLPEPPESEDAETERAQPDAH